jgi:hypothetical protein
MTCKGCGGPVKFHRGRKQEPLAFCDNCTPNLGEFNGSAKLTAEKVLAIRRAPPRYCLLAAQFGASLSTITDIRKRRSWQHI